MDGSLFYRPTTLEDAYPPQTLSRLLHLNLRTIRNLSLDLFPPCLVQNPVLETGKGDKIPQTLLLLYSTTKICNILVILQYIYDKIRFRSRRPPSFQDSNSGSQAVKSLPVRENTVRRTQASNSERIQVCKRLQKYIILTFH